MRDDARETTPIRLDTPVETTRSRDRGLARLAAPLDGAALALRLAAARDRFVDAARRDLDGGLALPGLVVVFACGIGLYFELPAEPWPPAVGVLAAVVVVATWMRRRAGHPARLAAVLAALVLGVAAASWETHRVAAPRLDHERTVTVEGRVVDLEATAAGGLRLIVDVHRVEGRGLGPTTTPSRITATLTARGWRPDVGDGVRFKARLKPPEGPVMPGGYDFARRAWFEGRGAGGYVLGRVEPIDLGPPPTSERWLGAIGSLRHTIAERVRAALPGESGTIAAALMVGEQRAIPESAAEPLRASGLTHIVSISGLHMGLVAGAVIVVFRAVFALFPALALGRPIKKWAAVAAFVVATIYLLLSGNQVAALRSHLMLSVALLAVLVDRPAITMHTVAVSAAAILAVQPSAVMEPSFRMSYLAVIALVASYDLYRLWAATRPPPTRDAGVVGRIVGGTLRQVEGFALSSLVAGLATAPVIAGTFFRAAPYSILANMAVLPVTGLVIMPAAVAAALAMPFGLELWPLRLMGLGIDWMIAVGRWTAALPAGSGLLGEPHPAMMVLGMAAVLWLSAWKSRIRLLGLLPAIAAMALLAAGPRPDVLIGRHGTAVAVRGSDGLLHVLGGRQDRFDTGIWLAADRDGRAATSPDLADGWLCDPLGCIYRSPLPAGKPSLSADPNEARPSPPVASASATVADDLDRSAQDAPALEIAVVRHPSAFDEDCRRAALVVTTLVAPPGCRALTTVVDRLDLARGGATAVDFIGPVRTVGPPKRVEPTTAPPTPGPGLAPFDPTRDADTPDDPPADRIDASARSTDPDAAGHAPFAAAPDPSDDVTLRRDVRIRTALPRLARPWTPLDPRLAALEREAAELDEALAGPRAPSTDGHDPRGPRDGAAPIPDGRSSLASPTSVDGDPPDGNPPDDDPEEITPTDGSLAVPSPSTGARRRGVQ